MSNEFLEIPSFDELDITASKFSEIEESAILKLGTDPTIQSKAIDPQPGFCIKTRCETDEKKVFINVCHCKEVPKPPDISKNELAVILASNDPSSYRVPISIGEAHEELDKSGKECVCFDVVINSEFFELVEKNNFFCAFLITLCCECVGEKFNLSLKNEQAVILKNKTYHGNMPKHFIRSKPFIAELNSEYSNNQSSEDVVRRPDVLENSVKSPEVYVSKQIIIPKYSLSLEPKDSIDPSSLLLEIELPNVVTGEHISTQLGKARLIMYEETNKYSLDVPLPYLVHQESGDAVFDVFKKVLFVTLPIDHLEANNKCLCTNIS